MIARCTLCGFYWAHNAHNGGPDDPFQWITRYCPTCLERRVRSSAVPHVP